MRIAAFIMYVNPRQTKPSAFNRLYSLFSLEKRNDGQLFVTNKRTYDSKDVVLQYSNSSQLQKPEQAILVYLSNSLKDMKMLDIGIGGGRTTGNFMNLVSEYVGIDYSENMINACMDRFRGSSRNISFKVCDVRSMEMFKDNYFDFILFSYNGLDSISHEDRQIALKEIHRVGQRGGFFCFSAHNLLGIDQLLTVRWFMNPMKMYREILRYFLLRFRYNRHVRLSELRDRNFSVINDGTHQFRSLVYYITPKEQIRQLRRDFYNIRVFSSEDGDEIPNSSHLEHLTDLWLYYLCRIR